MKYKKMSSNKAGDNFNYREAKKTLNKTLKFSFRLPRKDSQLTPQQKATIKKAWFRLGNSINRIEDDTATFKSFSSLKGVDKSDNWVKTNKGYIIPHSKNQTIKISNIRGKRILRVNSENQDELFIKYHLTDGDLLEWVNKKLNKYSRYGYKRFLLSINGYNGKISYTQDDIYGYLQQLINNNPKVIEYIDGIYLYKSEAKQREV